MTTMRTSHAAVSDLGRVRDNNEDAYVADDRHGIYAVADGVGGHRAGEVASRSAIDAAHAAAKAALAQLEHPCDRDQLIAVARRAVEHACEVVYQLGKPDGEHAGAATTLTLLLVDDTHAALAHVGDSRLYLARDGSIEQLSVDHTFPNELRRAGLLSPAKAEKHPLRHVLSRSLGSQPSVVVDTLAIDLHSRDVLVLTSDGLNEAIDETGLIQELPHPVDLRTSAERLVKRANELGGRDNSTAVLILVENAIPSPRSKTVELLSPLPMFAGIDLAARSRVVGAGSIVTLARGATLLSKGERLDGLWLVIEGRLGWSGPQVSADLEPGGWFGEVALTHPHASSASVTAHEAACLFHLTAAELSRLARRRPLLGVTILGKLARALAKDQPAKPHVGASPSEPTVAT